jgi:hypothetical protein
MYIDGKLLYNVALRVVFLAFCRNENLNVYIRGRELLLG